MATIKFSSDQIKSLINLYQVHECMWNVHSPAYHDRNKKRRVGQKIADALELPVDAVMKKWANLRTYFLKEVQKLEKANKNETDQVKQSDWIYFDHMNEFMHNQCHRRNNSTTNLSYTQNGNDEDRSGSSDSQTIQPDVTYGTGSLSDIESSSLPAIASSSQPVMLGSFPAVDEPVRPFENGGPARKRRKRQKQNEEEDALVTVMREAVQAMNSAMGSGEVMGSGETIASGVTVAAVTDEHDDYAKTVANSLRSIADDQVRERTKIRMNELLFEARFGSV